MTAPLRNPIILKISDEELAAWDRHWRLNGFANRSDMIRTVVNAAIGQAPDQPEPVAEPEPAPDPLAETLPPGAIVPLVRKPATCHAHTPMVQQRVQRLMDDTRRTAFTETEVLAAVYAGLPTPVYARAETLNSMRELRFEVDETRAGQAKGARSRVFRWVIDQHRHLP